MSNAFVPTQRQNGRGARYKEFVARWTNCEMKFSDFFKFKFIRLAKDGNTELPAFGKLAVLRSEKGREKNIADRLKEIDDRNNKLDEKMATVEMLGWLLWMRDSKSSAALNYFYKQMTGKQETPLAAETDTQGIENMVCRAAGGFTDETNVVVALPTEELSMKKYNVNQQILELTVDAMLHASLSSKNTPKLDLYQTKDAIIIRVQPRVDARAEMLLKLAEPFLGHKIGGNSVPGAECTLIEIKEKA